MFWVTVTFLVSISHGFNKRFLLETLTRFSIFIFCHSVFCNFIFILGIVFELICVRLYESLYEYSFVKGKFTVILVMALSHLYTLICHFFTVIVLDTCIHHDNQATVHCTSIFIWLLWLAFSSTFKINLDLLKFENLIFFHWLASCDKVPLEVEISNVQSNICHTLFPNLSVHLTIIGNLDHCKALSHWVKISRLWIFQGTTSKVSVLVTHFWRFWVQGKHI